ncbi:hypothetical protein HDU67_000736 [Dinochytrium kinnereticum]|nr:hypothetical protein HDU67_000736 [Dinochytrium kinnereticum]
MGAKGSKRSRPSSPTKKNNEPTNTVPISEAWKDSEFSKPAWTPPSKLLALDAENEVKKRLKTWCGQNKGAIKQRLGDVVELYDDIAKRRAVFQSGQRCGDSKERGEEVLEASARKLIEKFLTEGGAKDMTSLVGEEWKGDKLKDLVLTDASCFESLQAFLSTKFEESVSSL